MKSDRRPPVTSPESTRAEDFWVMFHLSVQSEDRAGKYRNSALCQLLETLQTNRPGPDFT